MIGMLWILDGTSLSRKNSGMDAVRMDKWLWAARFFKTRALASKACELGRIDWKKGEIASTPANKFAGDPGTWQPAKAAREVHVADMLKVKNDSGEFVIEVLGLSGVRGSATVAQGLYRCAVLRAGPGRRAARGYLGSARGGFKLLQLTTAKSRVQLRRLYECLGFNP